MYRRTVTSLFTLLLLLASFSTFASIKEAKEYYDKAESHYDKSEFAKALTNYTKAFELSKKYEMYFNIAQCHRHLKNYEKALFFYKRFLGKFPNSAYREEVLKQITLMENALKEQQLKIKTMGRISVVTKPPGAQILINTFQGTPEGFSPAVVYVAEGTHLLVIKKEGYKTVNTRLTVSKGEMKFVEMTLVPLAQNDPSKVENPVLVKKDKAEGETKKVSVTSSPTETPKPPHTPFYKKWWFITGASVAVVGAAGGVFFGIRTLDYKSKYDDAHSPADRDKYKSDGETSALLTDISLGIALGAAITTTVLLLLDKPTTPAQNSPDEGGEAASSFSLIPMCTRGFCGLNAAFRF